MQETGKMMSPLGRRLSLDLELITVQVRKQIFVLDFQPKFDSFELHDQSIELSSEFFPLQNPPNPTGVGDRATSCVAGWGQTTPSRRSMTPVISAGFKCFLRSLWTL